MRLKRLYQTGDTIIEAMIAVAVIGMTIASAYAISTRSLKAARQAQERGEALKYAEGQIEAIRAIAASDTPDDNIYDSQLFCVTEAGAIQTFGSTEIPDLITDTLEDYHEACQRGNSLYNIAVEANGLTNRRYQYTVVVRWFGLGENRIEEMRLDYRAYREVEG